MIENQDTRQLLRAHLKETINIKPVIENVKAGTFVPLIPDIDLALYKGEKLYPGVNIWDALKPERNARIAIIIEKMWEDSRREIHLRGMLKKDFTPFRLKDESIFPGSENYSLYFRFIETLVFILTTSLQVAVKEMDESHPDSTERLAKIIWFGSRMGYYNQGKLGTSEDVVEFISRGIGSAVMVGFQLAEIINRLSKANPLITKEQKKIILRQTMKTHGVQFASLNLKIFPRIHSLITTHPVLGDVTGGYISEKVFKEDFFKLSSDEPRKLLVDWKKIFELEIDGKNLSLIEPFKNTTKCPAMFAEGDETDVLRETFKLIEQIIDIHGERIFTF